MSPISQPSRGCGQWQDIYLQDPDTAEAWDCGVLPLAILENPPSIRYFNRKSSVFDVDRPSPFVVNH